MAKKEKAKKEKPLEKMTAKELRDVALTIPDISGAHGMNKTELISAIKESRGIVEEKKEKGSDIRELKKKIVQLKEDKKAAQESGDKKQIEIMRKKLSRIKKKTRCAA